jgi:CheY-like chemotaxis protein
MNDVVRARSTGRVLVIDDYDDARSSVRDALEEQGYGVVEAAHGQEALHFLVSNAAPAVSLIVLDLQMPVMDGWQFLKLLSSYIGLRRIPVLILSAHPPQLQDTDHQAVVGVLHKPYEMPQLLAMVSACLSH